MNTFGLVIIGLCITYPILGYIIYKSEKKLICLGLLESVLLIQLVCCVGLRNWILMDIIFLIAYIIGGIIRINIENYD